MHNNTSSQPQLGSSYNAYILLEKGLLYPSTLLGSNPPLCSQAKTINLKHTLEQIEPGINIITSKKKKDSFFFWTLGVCVEFT